MKQAKTYEEIALLIQLCKTGKLFDVQTWIADGKPINPPFPADKKRRKKSPLQIAIDKGFHSLVQLLLESGADLEEPHYCPLEHVLQERRLDLVQLLVKHGADIHSVDIKTVFDTWSNEIVEFFIENGADLETGNPLAYALCSRIRPALGIFKRYEDRLPGLREQVNIALRHHCKKGNLKWVSLMLWTGANPYEKGPDFPDESDPDACSSALELAAFYGHSDIFKLKKIRLDPANPGASDLLWNVCYNENSDILKMLLERGFTPKNLKDKGSSLIQSLLSMMNWYFGFYGYSRLKRDIDTSRSREKIKMIHMLARHGVKWEPKSQDAVNSVRRSLLKMKHDYIMDFIWIMSEYEACTYATVEALMKTPAIRSLVSKHLPRFNELMESFHDHS